MPTLQLQAETVKAEAFRLGFSACGLAEAQPVGTEAAARFDRYLAEGRHATIDYLVRQRELRLDPRRLLPGTRTVVSVALNYYPARRLAADRYRFAYYAYGLDYHDVVRRRLRTLFERLRALYGSGLEGRAFCDTAPLPERYWAWKAGLGWTGRNTQLILPGQGSYFFLGELLLNAPADRYATPLAPQCGTCRCCLDACPGRALDEAGGLDARRCLSYLTIEHRGPLPEGVRLGRCIYGCDRCQTVCPHNLSASPTDIPEFSPSDALMDMRPADWQALSVERYRALFRGSAVKRAKYEGLMRNIRAVRDIED